ncbi:MAG: ABC transporter permease [Dehalococcoidales bacterium]|nr:ABC transporter permease [Dehalococcoidales bacterium]
MMDKNVTQHVTKQRKPPEKLARAMGFIKILVKKQPLGAASAVIILLLIIVALFAPLLAPYDPQELHLSERLQPSSPEHILGTDQLGRDELSRLIYGARITLFIGVSATAVATAVSAIIGMFSGFIGGLFDLIVQRFIDAWMCFPGILLLMTIMSLVGSGYVQITVVMGILFGIGGSRLVRGAVMGIKENMYVEAGRAIGATTWYSVLHHILPNIMPTILIIFTVSVGGIVLTESSLSFLGFGIPIGTPSWGGMLSWEGRNYMTRMPTLALWPGLALSIVVYAFNMFGDSMRDLLDPRLKGGSGRYRHVKLKPAKKSVEPH